MAKESKSTGNNPNGQLRDLLQSDMPGAYAYPRDVGFNDQPMITFRRYKYNRKKREELAKKRTLSTIHLPIPANLQVQYQANYTNIDLGFIGNQVAQKGASFADSVLGLSSGSGSSKQEIEASLYDSISDSKAPLLRKLVEKTGNLVGGNVLSGAQLASGVAINPHLAALFENVGFRTHQFQYKMIARNQQESLDIRDIILIMKYAMHPRLQASGEVFEFPDEWYIQFNSGFRRNLFDFAPAVLTDLQVSYNGSNVPVFFEDTKAPVDIDLSLTFQEVEILTKNKLEKEFSDDWFDNKKSSRDQTDIIEEERRSGGGSSPLPKGGPHPWSE